MVRMRGKKLPPHWVYIPSPRQIRAVLEELHLDRDVVVLSGTGSGPGPAGLTLGFLLRQVRDGAWEFRLTLWGVPEAAVGDHRDLLAAAALGVIRDGMMEYLAQPAVEAVKPTQTWLRFALTPDAIVSSCSTHEIDYSRPGWWRFRNED